MSFANLSTLINPATGLPMTSDDYGGIDVGGSPYGIDIHPHHHPWSSLIQ